MTPPRHRLRAALAGAKRVVVFEKSLAVGMGGILAADVRMALADQPVDVRSVVGGLGGRPITRENLRRMFDKTNTHGQTALITQLLSFRQGR